jgi:hypothetical protein
MCLSGVRSEVPMVLLTLDAPRPPLALQAVEHLIQWVATWETELFSERLKDQARSFAPGTPKLK